MNSFIAGVNSFITGGIVNLVTDSVKLEGLRVRTGLPVGTELGIDFIDEYVAAVGRFRDHMEGIVILIERNNPDIDVRANLPKVMEVAGGRREKISRDEITQSIDELLRYSYQLYTDKVTGISTQLPRN